MELQTISQVSKEYNISTRTLRYYEQIGLLPSVKKEDYAYRTYDMNTIVRLQQVIILRKLRIPLKQIGNILENKDTLIALEVFRKSLYEIDEEIKALSLIRSILKTFTNKLSENKEMNMVLDLLGDETILKIVEELAVTKLNLKEDKSMNDLNKANEVLTKLQDIRILHIPSLTVASFQCEGENPEDRANELMNQFVHANQLHIKKQDIRVLGFNNPNPDETGKHGYEFWVTIPEDMEVSEPGIKKHFEGGLYAAHCIKMGDFNEWPLFYKCVCESEEYERELREPLGMDGSIEEHLNAYTYYNMDRNKAKFAQIDLLIPIKQK
ncbi:MAG: MerR family transcriptional regulator [Clostridiales bacterium]|jgi:DNA-binding transcriptional MerR regulator|nr:MerR family transcriptional regulator [Clostridiales bacterium]